MYDSKLSQGDRKGGFVRSLSETWVTSLAWLSVERQPNADFQVFTPSISYIKLN